MTSKNKLDALVLLGGKSSRMKESKAHLLIDGQPQWQRCHDLLAPICHDVYFSISPQLVEPLLVNPDRQINDIFVEPIGPLGGIISAFKKKPDSAFFVLACDMPFFSSEAAAFIKSGRDITKLATVFENSSALIEPLCGIYEPEIFSHLLNAWSRGLLCPRKILAELNIHRLKPKNQTWLKNINSKEELALVHAQKNLQAKTVTVHFYAALRDQARLATTIVSSHAHTLSELYQELAATFGLTIDAANLRFAKNTAMVASHSELCDGDNVVFMPPLSGG
jgi:molybdopterin-guanine dinucleotide biosynthesis protein A